MTYNVFSGTLNPTQSFWLGHKGVNNLPCRVITRLDRESNRRPLDPKSDAQSVASLRHPTNYLLLPEKRLEQGV